MAETRFNRRGTHLRAMRTLRLPGPAGSPLALLILAAAVCVGLASCTVITKPQAPGAMNVNYEIQDFKDGQTHISVGFTDAKLNPIEFVSGETVACNGTFLRYSVGHYIGDIPKQPDTGTYTLTYTPAQSAQSSSTTPTTAPVAGPISIAVKVVPATVVVTQPTSGAPVPIPSSAPLTIQYQPATLANTSVSALAADGRGHWTFTLPQAESGAIAMPADNFANFAGGPGTLSITRETVSYPSDTGFRAVEAHFKNITQVPITWQ